MEDCLTYFQQAVEHPDTVVPWDQWWLDHSEDVRRCFARADYLKLKFHKLTAARDILVRERRVVLDERRVHPLDQTHCLVCGQLLFKALPHVTTREEIVEFSNRIGRADLARDQWIHPGVYCPNGCTSVMLNFRHPSA